VLVNNDENSWADFPKKKTLLFEGIVDLSQESNLQPILLDTLISCDHLVVNLEKVTEVNGSLLLLLCSLHQTTQHISKRLTIQVSESGPFNCTNVKALCPRSINCLLEHCFLRERVYEEIPENTGNENIVKDKL
jgi:hypothetical protein